MIPCRINWIIKQWFELSLCFCRVTSVRMCASLSSSHPSICADDEQGSISRETEIKYSQRRLFPCYFKEMIIWFILAALVWICAHFFLPSTWDREEPSALLLLLLLPANRIRLLLLSMTASSGSPEPLPPYLPPLPPVSVLTLKLLIVTPVIFTIYRGNQGCVQRATHFDYKWK